MFSFLKKRKHSTPVIPLNAPPYLRGQHEFISCNAVWPWDDSVNPPVLVTVNTVTTMNPMLNDDCLDDCLNLEKPMQKQVMVPEEDRRSKVLLGAFQTKKLD